MAIDSDDPEQKKRLAEEAAANQKAADEDEAAKKLLGSVAPTMITAESIEPELDPTTLGREKKESDTTLTGDPKDDPSKKSGSAAKKPDDSGISPWEKIWENVGMGLKAVDGARSLTGKAATKGIKMVYEKVQDLRETLAAQKDNGHELAPNEGESITPAHNQMQQQRGSMSPPEPDKREENDNDNGTPAASQGSEAVASSPR